MSAATVDLDGAPRTLQYQYDDNGNRTRVTHPDGAAFSYQFDDLDRVTGVGEGGSTNNLLTISYQPNGRRAAIERTGAAETQYAYDSLERLTALTQDLTGTTADLTTTLSYSPASQITTLNLSNPQENPRGQVLT